jgi:hypothetical protein
MAKYAAKFQRVAASQVLSVGGVNAITTTQLRRGKIGDVILGSDGQPDDKAVQWRLTRYTSPGTSSPVTPSPIDPADAAFCGAAGESHSVDPTYTVGQILLFVSFNQRATFRWMAAPGGELVYPAVSGNGIGISTPSILPTGTPQVTAHIYLEE